MADATRPALQLIKTQAPVKKKTVTPKSRPSGSSILIEVERGQMRKNQVNALTPEDALALLSGLAMALVQVVRASQGA